MLGEIPSLADEFKKAIDEHLELRSTVNRYGERNIDLVSGFAEKCRDSETFVDYSAHPREYSLSAVQTVVRVHTRVSDLYNGPYDQLEEQMRLTIEGIKERQEWELINNNKFGLVHSADPAMRSALVTGRRRRMTWTSCWRWCGRSRRFSWRTPRRSRPSAGNAPGVACRRRRSTCSARRCSPGVAFR